MKPSAPAVVLLSVVPLITAGQQPTRVSGLVLADDTGNPIANARVILTSPSQTAAILTDRDGRFVLALSSSPARVTVAASKTGYGRREVTAALGEAIEVRLARGAAISGRVVNVHGDPVMNARVVAETAATAMGAPVPGAAATGTDDRGEYRIGSLAADTFRVAVITQGAPTRRQMPGGGIAIIPSPVKTYYPDAAAPDTAEAIRLTPGEDRPSIDFVVANGQPGMEQMMMMATPLGFTAPTVPSARPTAVVRGRVVTTDARAVPRAQVRLMPTPAPPAPGAPVPRPTQPSIVTADDDGRFEFVDLTAGSYRIAAMKMGYSPPGERILFGPPAPTSGLTVDLTEGQTRERADITLARWGSLAGRIVDELGDPMQGVSVQLLQVRYQAGRRRLVAAAGASRVTDDLGRFRTYGIAPGQYIVSATVGDTSSADLPGYTRSYYPGTTNAGEAQFVSIGVSQDMSGIEVAMARTRTALVSGTLLDAAGQPTMGGSLKLMPSQRSDAAAAVPMGARITPDGRFEFGNVAPGQYVIQADRGRRNASTDGEFGTLPVAVDGVDVTNLVLQMSAGSSITGSVRFDSYQGATIPAPGAIDILPAPVDPDQSPANPAYASIHDDWTFEVNGVNGPRRLQVPRVPAEWTLKEIRVRGIDVTDQPLPFGRANQSLADVEVVLTDQISEVTGPIVDGQGRPAPNAHVVIFATDRDRWYAASRFLRLAEAGADGAVAIKGLPPGSYYATAIARLPVDGDDAWQDPAYLETLVGRAAAFALGIGQKQGLSLKLP